MDSLCCFNSSRKVMMFLLLFCVFLVDYFLCVFVLSFVFGIWSISNFSTLELSFGDLRIVPNLVFNSLLDEQN